MRRVKKCVCCAEAVLLSPEVCCSMEIKQEQARLFTLFYTAGRNPHCGPPLPEILLGDLFILPISFYKFKAILHRRESFPFPPTIHFSHINVKTNSVLCWEGPLTSLEKHCHLEDHGAPAFLSHSQLPDKSHSRTKDTEDRAGITVWLLYRMARWWVREQLLLARSVSVA